MRAATLFNVEEIVSENKPCPSSIFLTEPGLIQSETSPPVGIQQATERPPTLTLKEMRR